MKVYILDSNVLATRGIAGDHIDIVRDRSYGRCELISMTSSWLTNRDCGPDRGKVAS